MTVYLQLQQDVDTRGVIVAGRDGNLIKNPSLSPLQATRADLIRLSKSVPLFTGKIDRSEVDKQIADILNGD
jgi:hypothetical protein